MPFAITRHLLSRLKDDIQQSDFVTNLNYYFHRELYSD